jgi:hypothetical protein
MKHVYYGLASGVLAASLGTASAQSPQADHHLTFREVDPQTGQSVPHPNGVLEPGEGALIQISVSFSPPVGTPAVLSGGVSATMHALAFTRCDLTAIHGSAEGQWVMRSLAPGWTGSTGFVTTNGSILLLEVGQQPHNADTSNPLPNLWSGIWIPDDYSARTLRFHTVASGVIGPWTSATYWAVEKPPPEYTGVITRTEIGYVDVPISPVSICYANCDQSTEAPVLNVADFSCFLQKFAAGEPYANCDGSTTEPVLNVADFACFLARFAAGCE